MKLKRIGLIALSISSLFAVAACSSGESSTTTTTPTTTPTQVVTNNEVYPDVTLAGNTGEYREVYSSFTVNSDNVKKIFYLGDSFETTGLKVIRNYLLYNKDGSRADLPAKQYETNEYSIDSSEVDMNTVGKYPVYVTCRVGTSTNTDKYEIEVRSSIFESSPGLEYISGVDVSYTDDTMVKTYTVQNGGNPIDLTKNDLKIRIHKKTIASDLTATDQIIATDETKVSYDFTKINKDAVGSYMIKVTYDGGKVTAADGKEYDNKVVSYVLVYVKNDPVSISAGGINKDTFNQTIDGIDLSNWKIRITREVGYEIVKFSKDLFEVSGLDNFKVYDPANPDTKKIQNITIRLKEDSDISYSPSVKIIKSTTQDIIPYSDLMPLNGTISQAGGDYTIPAASVVDGYTKLANVTNVFGPIPYDSATKKGCKYTDRTNKTGAMDSTNTWYTDKYDSLLFNTRIQMNGSAYKIKVIMDKPGDICVFFSPQNGESVEFVMQDSIGEELDTALSTSNKQEVVKYVFHVDAAGTYYFFNPSGGIYFHGIAIATNKD